jgi:hypothetical protein
LSRLIFIPYSTLRFFNHDLMKKLNRKLSFLDGDVSAIPI